MQAWVNAANVFTLVRLASVPFIVRAILNQQHETALAIFVVAALTDAIDGTLARHFHMATQFGAYLDPITDKLFLSSIYLSLAAAGSVPVWLVALIFGRDLAMLTASGIAYRFLGMRRFPPSVFGKASTFFQIVCAAAVLGSKAGLPLGGFTQPLVWPAAALTTFSGVHYIWRGLRRPAL